MNISSNRHGSVDVVKLPHRLVMANAPAVRKELLELIDTDHHHLVLDLGEVAFVDSSGLSVLVSALKAANKNAGSVALLNLLTGGQQPRPVDQHFVGHVEAQHGDRTHPYARGLPDLRRPAGGH